MEQSEYSMLKRDKIEGEFADIFNRYGYGSTVFSPLCYGILSGKYNNGNIPDGSRFDSDDPVIKDLWNTKLSPETRDATFTTLHKVLRNLMQLLCIVCLIICCYATNTVTCSSMN